MFLDKQSPSFEFYWFSITVVVFLDQNVAEVEIFEKNIYFAESRGSFEKKIFQQNYLYSNNVIHKIIHKYIALNSSTYLNK